MLYIIIVTLWYQKNKMGKYKIHNQQSIHFLTLTVVGWIDVFTRTASSSNYFERTDLLEVKVIPPMSEIGYLKL